MEKRKLFIVLTVITVLLIIAGGFAVSVFIRNQLTESLVNQYAVQEGLQARQIAQTLELEIHQTEAKLNLIAQLPEVMSGDTAACNAKLLKIFNDPQTKVGNLGRVGPDGLFRCSLNSKLIGLKAATLGPYIQTIFDDPAHASVMSRAIKPPGAPSYLVAIHVPVWDKNGAFIGTLGGAVYLSDLQTQYLTNVPLAPGGYIALFDDDGTVLYHYKPELIGLNLASPVYQKFVSGGLSPAASIQGIKDGVSGTRRYSFDNSEKIAAYEPVHIFPGRNWRVLVTVPVAAAHASIVQAGIDGLLQELPIVLSLLLIVIFPFFILVVIRRIFDPIEEVDKAKSEFISIASHQLRTPLGSVRWNLELLEDEAKKLSTEGQERLQEAVSSNLHVIGLVGDLLNVTRIEQGRLKPEPANFVVEAVMHDTLAEVAPEAADHKVTLSDKIKPPTLQVYADPKWFREVMLNLLTNAIKYTHKGGTITIKVEVIEKMARFTVSDNGIGIPLEDQSKVFAKFYRAEAARKLDTGG
jgi:signal transduction histidine kinase